DCSEGRSGAHRIAPLDLYMMGLLDGSAVPPVPVFSGAFTPCGNVVQNIVGAVTIADIQEMHGVRTPGPAEAQRDFSLGFVAESHARLLDATETTFYDIRAAHYTRP